MNSNSRSTRFGKIARVCGLSLGILLIAPGVFAKKDAYKFKFGLMLNSPSGNEVVYLETNEIEKRVDPSYLHGFTIVRKNGAQFYLSYKVRFPEPLKNLPEAIHDHYDVLENGRALKSKEELVWESSQSFVFEESDPVGEYEIEVYADGELYRKIKYNVSGVSEFGF